MTDGRCLALRRRFRYFSIIRCEYSNVAACRRAPCQKPSQKATNAGARCRASRFLNSKQRQRQRSPLHIIIVRTVRAQISTRADDILYDTYRCNTAQYHKMCASLFIFITYHFHFDRHLWNHCADDSKIVVSSCVDTSI